MKLTTGVRRRRADAWLALASGALSVALLPLAAADLPRLERTLFDKANRAGYALPALRIPQQLGTPWLLPTMSLVGFWTHRPHLTVSAALALPLEKGGEIAVKNLTRRRRPARAADPVLRDDAPVDGPSYPSGHAAIATCAAFLVAPYLPAYAGPGLLAALGLTSYARLQQGAHFPLDLLGGVLLGVASGSFLNYAFGLPVP
jgi:membrane-associated phospholipid phosphatase